MSFDPVAFGRRLAAARVWAGLEPKQLAVALGISSETIHRLERGIGKRPPSMLVVQALARELDQPAEWLLAGDEPPWRTAMQPKESADLLERARAQAVRLADEAEALAALFVEDNDGEGAATG